MRLFRYLWVGILLLGALDVLGQELSFGYDVAGNQVQRLWVCSDCPPAAVTPVLGRDSLLLPGDAPLLGDRLVKVFEVDFLQAVAYEAGACCWDAFVVGAVLDFQAKWFRSLFSCGRSSSGG